jgi:hypothetical protein
MFQNYSEEKFNPGAGFDAPPPGKYRVRIEEAEETTSKSGMTMIKLSLKVSGYPGTVFHYIVDNEYAQRNLDQFFDSFGIRPGDFNYLGWRGRVGAAQLKTEQYNGNDQAKVSYFILRSRQEGLPAWTEAGGPSGGYGGGYAHGVPSGGPSSLRDDPAFSGNAEPDAPFIPF